MAELKLTYRIAVSIVNLISKTWRIRLISGSIPEKGIVVFWHGFMLPAWYILRNRKPVAVVSQSKDGEILSTLLLKWNYQLIRGSSSKDGSNVLSEIENSLKSDLIAMTPDGPRGPKQKMKSGAVVASARTGFPIYLMGISIRGNFIFKKSWDNFILPLPFSSISITMSEPMNIESGLTREEIEERIMMVENQLIQLYK